MSFPVRDNHCQTDTVTIETVQSVNGTIDRNRNLLGLYMGKT